MYFMKRFLMYVTMPPLIISLIAAGIYGLTIVDEYLESLYKPYVGAGAEFLSGITIIGSVLFVFICFIAAAHDAACKVD